MEREKFLKRMESIDEKIRTQSKNMDISHRVLEAFIEFEKDYEGVLWGPSAEVLKKLQKPFEGVNLFEEINKWYSLRYGEKSYMQTDVGEIPVIIRGEIFLIRIPLVYGAPQIDVLRLVDKMTNHMVQSLNKEEMILIYRAFELGANFFYALDWQIDKSAQDIDEKITIQSKQLLSRGIEDIKTAISRIKNKPDDIQDCCFHAQQAVEKFLKGHLTAFVSIEEKTLKEIGHNLRKLIKKVSENLPGILNMKDDIEKVDFPMDIRYQYFNITIEKAMESIYSCIRICYFILQAIYNIKPLLVVSCED